MGKVLTENLEVGMVLGADVHDRNGRLLLGAGCELVDKHIFIFQTWGVVEADIVGVEEEGDNPHVKDPIDPALWEATEAKVRHLFRHADATDPFMHQLLKLSVIRRVRHEGS